MRTSTRTVALLALLAAVSSAATIDTFRQWAKAHNKLYTADEEARRYSIFARNVEAVARLNQENHGAGVTFAPNRFADLEQAEFRRLYTSELAARQPGQFAVVADDVKESLDMRSYLPPVKDQAQCGSCWAFSAVANMEGQTYLKTKRVTALSEQQLVSCDKSNNGCNGGLMSQASEYAVKNGAATEDAYPYVSGSGDVPRCRAFNAAARFTSVENWGKIKDDATIISHLRQYGPLSIAIAADSHAFMYYQSGVLDSKQCGTQLDHGVALVGYGTDAATGKPYWTVRNSWGSSWGEQGYIRVVRGRNMCGINGELSSIVA